MKKVIRQGDLKLQPLRIPPGWTVRQNILLELCPTQADDFEIEGPGSRDPWLLFSQNLLHLKETSSGRIALDVGWYPDSDPSGQYGVLLVVDEEWERPYKSVDARTLHEAVDAIEQLAGEGLVLAFNLR